MCFSENGKMFFKVWNRNAWFPKSIFSGGMVKMLKTITKTHGLGAMDVRTGFGLERSPQAGERDS